jgi:hypothetical protein
MVLPQVMQDGDADGALQDRIVIMLCGWCGNLPVRGGPAKLAKRRKKAV